MNCRNTILLILFCLIITLYKFTSVIFYCLFLCKIIRFFWTFRWNSVQGSSWVLPTSESSFFHHCVKNDGFLSEITWYSFSPLLYLDLLLLHHYCSYLAQIWFHTQRFCLSVGPCPGRDPWLVIFKSGSGYTAAVPYATNAGLLYPLMFGVG